MSGVELRIHGVGGSTPEALLGEATAERVRLFDRERRCGIWVRTSDHNVRGFVWGPLTSGSRLQPFWVVLFPFTLLNAAGWMHRRVAGGKGARTVTAVRGVVTALGIALTITWVLWLAVILVDQLAYQAAREVEAVTGGWAFVIAIVLTLAFGAGYAIWRMTPYVIAMLVPVPVAAAATSIDDPRVRVSVGGVALVAVLVALITIAAATRNGFENVRGESAPEPTRGTTRRSLGDNEDLSSPSFFDHPGDSGRLLWVHGGAVAGTLAYLGVRAWDRTADEAPSLSFGSAITLMQAVQFALIAVLLLLTFRPASWRRGWRFAGPAVAAMLALMITNGVFAGVEVWVAERFDLEATTGSEMAFLDVYAILVLVFITALVTLWLPFFLRPEPPPSDVDPRWRGPVAQRRHLATAFRNIDPPLSGFCFCMLAAGVAVALVRVERLGWDPRDWRFPTDGQIGWAVSIGSWALPLAALAVPGLIRLAVRSGATRRNVGNVWDVLTFWPRRFHPLGVRPYAELAVPALQDHLVAGAGGQRVVVSAHSQGSVLAYAALAGLDRAKLGNSVSLVTYGSPLSVLHGNFFPHYFHQTGYIAVHCKVQVWRNLYRLTDHIGQRVDLLVDCPPLADPSTTDPGPVAGETDLEANLPPNSRISGHNDYRREHAVKALVFQLRTGGQ